MEVLRKKNRLDPDLSSLKSGGYRDLLMNIRFKDAMGNPDPNGHIMELQLNLKSFVEQKHTGHAIYKLIRDIQRK